MEEIYKCAIVDNKINKDITKRLVVDIETGEILAIEWKVKQGEGVFPGGSKAVICTAMFSRDITPDSNEFIYIRDAELDEELYSFWKLRPKKKNKRAGNKPVYVKLYTEKLNGLTGVGDADIGFLVRLSGNIDWDTGRLIDKKTNKSLTGERMARLTGNSKATVKRRLFSLMGQDIIRKEKDGYFVNREYLAKG